jgi:hypothetical protein
VKAEFWCQQESQMSARRFVPVQPRSVRLALVQRLLVSQLLVQGQELPVELQRVAARWLSPTRDQAEK